MSDSKKPEAKLVFESAEIVGTGKNPKRKGGAKPNKNFLPFLEAQKLVQDEMIPSRSKYLEWWEANKPKALPRFPYRVYKDWVSWNDFLGTNNKFQDVSKKWRSLEEATMWAHTLKLQSYKQWMDWCRENKDKLPGDVPARPDLVYEKWMSWNHWLGSKPREAIEAIQEAEKKRIFYIIHYPDVPGNVMTYGTVDGLAALKERWEHDKFTVVRLFWLDPSKTDKVQNILSTLSTPYLGDDKQRITPNVYEIIFYLEMNLETVRNANQ